MWGQKTGRTQAEVRDWVLVGSGGAGDFWEKIGVGTGRRETETQTAGGDRWYGRVG